MISGDGMRRAERLFRLVNEMRTRSIRPTQDLAARFEVSLRTTCRDIAHLQRSGLPIEGEAGVGYLLRPGFDLPPMTFTNEQIDARAVALSFAESRDDPVLAPAAKELRARLQAGLPLPDLRRLASAPFYALRRSTGAPEFAPAVRKAIRLRRMVRMTDTNAQGQQTDPVLRPLAIRNLAEGWMFSGGCDLRQTFRTFRFGRVTQLVLTDQVFDRDDSRSLRACLYSDRCRARAEGFLLADRSGFFRLEPQGDAVHAVAQPRGRRAVGKDMAQMRVAARAMHLGALHEKAAVDRLAHHLRVQRRKEAGPAGAAFELRCLVEQRRIAAHAGIAPGGLRKAVVGKGAFGAMLARDLVGQVRQLRTPFGVGLFYSVHLL